MEQVEELMEEVAKRVEVDGIQAWWDLDARDILGADADSYEKVPDTLDVWFDSGSTHSSVVDVRPEFAGHAADMYLEVGEAQQALEAYRAAAKLAASDSFLRERALSYMGTGRAALAGGDEENAAKYFMSVALLFNDKELVPEALYQASVLYGKAGNATAAKGAADELRRDYGDSVWAKKLPAEEQGD